MDFLATRKKKVCHLSDFMHVRTHVWVPVSCHLLAPPPGGTGGAAAAAAGAVASAAAGAAAGAGAAAAIGTMSCDTPTRVVDVVGAQRLQHRCSAFVRPVAHGHPHALRRNQLEVQLVPPGRGRLVRRTANGDDGP